MKQISGAQCRMARGYLRWAVSDLAKAANVGATTIKRIESVDGILPTTNVGILTSIRGAFDATHKLSFEGDNCVIASISDN